MNKQRIYSPEVRERAERLLLDRQEEYDSQRAAFQSVSAKTGGTAETLRDWVRRTEADLGKGEEQRADPPP